VSSIGINKNLIIITQSRADSPAFIYDMNVLDMSKQLKATINCEFEGKVITCVSCLQSHNLISVGYSNGKIRVIEIGGQKLQLLSGHRGVEIDKMVMGYDDQKKVSYIFSMAKGKTNIIQWDAQKGQQLGEFIQPQTTKVSSSITTMTFAIANLDLAEKELPMLLVGSSDGSLNVWNCWGGKLLEHFDAHQDKAISVIVADQVGDNLEDLCFTASVDSSIGVFNLSKLKNVTYLQGHRAAVSSLSLSGLQSRLVSGSKDSTVRVWNLNDFSCIFLFKGHSFEVTNVFFMEPCFVYTAGADGKVGVWSIKEHATACIDFFQAHSAYINFMVAYKDKMFTGSHNEQSVKYHTLLNEKLE